MKSFASHLLTFLALSIIALTDANAVIINFTGGTVSGSGSVYVENGVRVEAIGGSTTFGDYYGTGNNVVHSHWLGGGGTMTKLLVTKVDSSAFDLNYFDLTTNTSVGGSAATGTEKTYIHASFDGISDDYIQLLPPENWGFPATSVFLGPQFDNIKAFWFTISSDVFCFGMDSFFIDQAAPEDPSVVPEPGSIALFGVALLSLITARRRAK